MEHEAARKLGTADANRKSSAVLKLQATTFAPGSEFGHGGRYFADAKGPFLVKLSVADRLTHCASIFVWTAGRVDWESAAGPSPSPLHPFPLGTSLSCNHPSRRPWGASQSIPQTGCHQPPHHPFAIPGSLMGLGQGVLSSTAHTISGGPAGGMGAGAGGPGIALCPGASQWYHKWSDEGNCKYFFNCSRERWFSTTRTTVAVAVCPAV